MKDLLPANDHEPEITRPKAIYRDEPRVSVPHDVYRGLREIAARARDAVCSPKWLGEADEDVLLEEALLRHGWVVEEIEARDMPAPWEEE